VESGIFLMRVSDLIAAFETYASDLIAPCRPRLKWTGQDDLGFLSSRRRGLWRGARDLVRLRDHGEGRAGDGVPLPGGWSDLGSWDALWQEAGPDDHGNAVWGGACARLHRHLPEVRGRHDRDRGTRASGRGGRGDARRGPCGRQVPCPGREGRGRHAAKGQGRPGRRLPALSPAMGLVRDPVPGRSVPGEADHGQARRHPQPAKPSPPLRALGRGGRDRRGDGGQRGQASDREPERLHPPGRNASHGQSRQAADVPHRGADRVYLGEDDIIRYEDIYNRA
jgi:hypothetical protein